MSYVGRFAPSPTGPLHVGSLTAAVASYLDARRHGGRWLVRIEDIDPPREPPGASDAILRTLEALALDWDGPVIYQSARREIYRDAAEELLAAGHAFRCDCSRSRIRATARKGPLGWRYPGTCRNRRLVHSAAATTLRVRIDDAPRIRFDDRAQGPQQTDLAATSGDYLVWRRDGLPAYHLAVVVDDAALGVTDVVRGVDLLPATAVHLHLQGALGFGHPRYAHLPVIINRSGLKLSKQTGARAADVGAPGLGAELLRYLGLALPATLSGAPYAELWEWASKEWKIDAVSGITEVRQRPRRAC